MTKVYINCITVRKENVFIKSPCSQMKPCFSHFTIFWLLKLYSLEGHKSAMRLSEWKQSLFRVANTHIHQFYLHLWGFNPFLALFISLWNKHATFLQHFCQIAQDISFGPSFKKAFTRVAVCYYAIELQDEAVTLNNGSIVLVLQKTDICIIYCNWLRIFPADFIFSAKEYLSLFC